MELKEKLVDLRKKKGLSQAELAEAINVSRQAISRWEVGSAIPSADNLMWLSKFYGVSIDELMGVDTNDKQPTDEGQQVISKEPVFPKKIAIVLCVIVVFIGVAAWIIFSVNERRENSETPPVSIGELDSYNIGSLNQEDEDGELGAELAIGVDGSAGPKTCVRLNAARNSEYYTTYGKPLSNSQWGRTKILAGNIEDVDLLARIILAESGYKNIDDQKGVAIVLKNRSVNSSSKYWESASLYPQASIYARVVGKDGHYGTVDVGTTDAQTPMRGYYGGEEEGFVDPGWKNAVDLAKAIVNGTTISVSAYKVSGKTVTSTKMTINTTSHKKYLNQIAWDQYVSWYNKGTIDTTVQPLTFKSTSGANVICKST